MASQGSSAESTASLFSTQLDHVPPAPLLSLLPAPVIELILQLLTLGEQLNECTHLCKSFPPVSASTIRHAPPLLLTAVSVVRLSQSARLLALFTSATSVVLHVDSVPRSSRAWQFVTSSPNVELLFPQLSSFAFKLSATVAAEEQRRRVPLQARVNNDAPAEPPVTPLSMLPLLPFLTARQSTLRSLSIVHPGYTLVAELTSLLTPLTSLRRLHLATQLIRDSLMQLMSLPLDILDLSDSELSHERPGEQPNELEAVPSRSWRVLRLPQPYMRMHQYLFGGLDAIVTARTSSTQPHTLSVQHMMSVAAAEQLINMPPSRSLAIVIAAAQAEREVFLSRAAAAPSFMAAPRQLHLSIDCSYWNNRTAMQPFIDFVTSHYHRLRSITLTELPRLDQVTNEALIAVSQCEKLESLSLSTSANRPRWPDTGPPSPEAVWSGQPPFTHLRTLSLTGLRGAQADVCRILSACPSLHICVLDLLDLSVDMLAVLASSCPLLRHLQLKVSDETALATSPTTNSERLHPVAHFRSLVLLDLHYTAWSRTRPQHLLSVMTRLYSLLDGSPLRQLTLMLRFEVQYQVALTSRLPVAVKLERMRVTIGEWEPFVAKPDQVTSGWDEEVDDVEERKWKQHRAAPLLPPAQLPSPIPVLPHAQPPTSSSLDSLDVIVSLDSLPIEHLELLLTHTPAITAIKLTIRYPDSVLLLSFLQSLAHIGTHCPRIERITYTLDGQAEAGDVQVVSGDEVRSTVDQRVMAEHAFGCLRCVCEIGPARQVLSQEAAAYVRWRWMSNVRGVAILDWHTPPPVQ